MVYVNQVFEFLHSHPEEGWKEYETSKYIIKELKEMGLEVKEKAGSDTGVIGILDTKKAGPILGLRGDIDALVFEKDGEKYCFHACGHSAHGAMVLATAKRFAENPPSHGKIYFIFQPAEEVLGGAESIVASHVIDDVQEIFGIHLRPEYETPMGEATPALVHAASQRILATIHGKNAHGARPHLGVNAVEIAVAITEALQRLHFNPKIGHSLKVTKIVGGSDMVNIIPDRCEIGMDIRAVENGLMDEMLKKIKETMIGITSLMGGELTFDLQGGVPAAEYDEELIESARVAIEKVLGKAAPIVYTEGGEDFHYYTQLLKAKSVYLGLGCGLVPGLHDPEMTFNEDALANGVDILEELLKLRLGE
ncbi:MAG: amidohydrolase [Tissierellia bacterium]|nr:amidohydrolase [Tissierellia bacterium]